MYVQLCTIYLCTSFVPFLGVLYLLQTYHFYNVVIYRSLLGGTDLYSEHVYAIGHVAEKILAMRYHQMS